MMGLISSCLSFVAIYYVIPLHYVTYRIWYLVATLFITCVLHCCTRVIAPFSDWTTQDREALQSARTHCRAESECLTRFKKVESGIYTAICGKDNN